MLKSKKITLFTVLVMIFNFIVPNAMMIVNAESSNAVLNKIVSIENSITEVYTLIDEFKTSDSYTTDISFKVATDYLENSFILEVTKFAEIKDKLSNNIKLSELILYVDDPNILDLYSEYLMYNNDPDLLINISSLEDITYSDPSTLDLKVLITKNILEEIIINNYLNDISSSIDNYNTYKLNNFISSYESIILEIDNKINDLNYYINLVKEYETEELLLGNNPNMLIDNTNIYILFDNINLSLEELKDRVDLSNTEDINSELLTLKDNYIDIYNKFVLNNNDFTLLESEITSLEELYNENINILNNYEDEKNILDYNDINDSFINITNKFNELNDKYNNLLILINDYLLRRPSDSSLVNERLNTLNKYVIDYDYTDTLELLAESTVSEDDIDIILNSTLLSEDSINKLRNKKLEFYEIKLSEDSNYKMIILDNLMVIEGTNILDINDFINNIYYDYNFSLSKDDDIYYITFYDKNNKELIKYQLYLKNDLNNDFILDSNDIELLKNIVINDNDFNILYDFNNDEILNIKDVTDLENYINNIYTSIENIVSNFNIVKEEINNKIIYKIYLVSNGVSNGFSFNINVSNDLKFKEYVSTYDILLDNEDNPNKIIGTGDFMNNTLLIELVYELDDDSEKTTFNLNNGIIVNNNGNICDNLTNLDIISRIVPVKEETSSANSSNNVINLDKTEQDSNSDPSEDKVTTVIIGDDIEVNNDNPSVSNIIKVVLVILLGVLLIYFLNKSDEYEIKKS